MHTTHIRTRTCTPIERVQWKRNHTNPNECGLSKAFFMCSSLAQTIHIYGTPCACAYGTLSFGFTNIIRFLSFCWCFFSPQQLWHNNFVSILFFVALSLCRSRYRSLFGSCSWAKRTHRIFDWYDTRWCAQAMCEDVTKRNWCAQCTHTESECDVVRWACCLVGFMAMQTSRKSLFY